MLSRLRRWIVSRVVFWVEYEDIVHKPRGVEIDSLHRDSDGKVVKDGAYWGSIVASLHNRALIHELETFIRAQELYVRDAVYRNDSVEEIARREAYFRGARAFRQVIDQANVRYEELTRERDGR